MYIYAWAFVCRPPRASGGPFCRFLLPLFRASWCLDTRAGVGGAVGAGARVVAFRDAPWGVICVVWRVRWQSDKLSRVEGTLLGLLPPQANKLLPQSIGQSGPHGVECPQDLAKVMLKR